MDENTLIVIPARLSSTRLPKKMLADIDGEPLIVKTYKRAVASRVGQVIVACDGEEIANVIKNAGGTAVFTDPELPSGTDRVFSAYKKYDPANKYEYIMNVQGDLPFIAPEFIQSLLKIVRDADYDISTLATKINDDAYLEESVVKVAIAFSSEKSGEALYFSRSPIPFGGPYYNHVGIYCFRNASLEKFVSLQQGKLEKTERLEQLRAMENGMSIGITVIDSDSPVSIDTEEDLTKARNLCSNGK